jgi:hypothetical protein
MVLLADMEGTIQEQKFLHTRPRNLPKNLCVYPLLFRSGTLEDLQRWAGQYPIDMTSADGIAYLTSNVERLIAYPHPLPKFEWLLNYLQDHFKPHGRVIKNAIGVSQYKPIPTLPKCLGHAWWWQCTKFIYSLPAGIFNDYKSLWEAFCDRHETPMPLASAIVGACKGNLDLARLLMQRLPSPRPSDVGKILYHTIDYLDDDKYISSVEFLLDEIDQVVTSSELVEGWKSYHRGWGLAIKYAMLNRCPQIFNLLMTYTPSQEMTPLAERRKIFATRILRALFAEELYKAWHTTRLLYFLSICGPTTSRHDLTTCESYFSAWGSLPWIDTLMVFLQDPYWNKRLPPKYSQKIFQELVTLAQPLTPTENDRLLQAVKNSHFTLS